MLAHISPSLCLGLICSTLTTSGANSNCRKSMLRVAWSSQAGKKKKLETDSALDTPLEKPRKIPSNGGLEDDLLVHSLHFPAGTARISEWTCYSAATATPAGVAGIQQPVANLNRISFQQMKPNNMWIPRVDLEISRSDSFLFFQETYPKEFHKEVWWFAKNLQTQKNWQILLLSIFWCMFLTTENHQVKGWVIKAPSWHHQFPSLSILDTAVWENEIHLEAHQQSQRHRKIFWS